MERDEPSSTHVRFFALVQSWHLPNLPGKDAVYCNDWRVPFANSFSDVVIEELHP
jgi:hypothetical protein